MPVITFTAHLERFWLLLTLDRQHPGSDEDKKQFEEKEVERERERHRQRERQTDRHTHTRTQTDRKEKGVIQMDRNMMSEVMVKNIE